LAVPSACLEFALRTWDHTGHSSWIPLNFGWDQRTSFHGLSVDHSGPSYEGRVSLNNPNANEITKLDLYNGYVGSYNILDMADA